MGSIVPTLTQAVGALNTVNSAFSAVNSLKNNAGYGDDGAVRQLMAEQDLALKQLQQRQAQGETQAAQDITLQKQQLALESAQAEEKRQAALRRAVARQRASFGGSGISSTGGSADAVLLGLFDESEEELQNREALDNLRNRALDQDLQQTKSVNVLQATQLAARSNLQRLFQ